MLTLPMTGETAGELGLASFVVPEDEVESRALDLMPERANGPALGCPAVRQILTVRSSGGVAGAGAVMLDVGLPLRAAADAARASTGQKSPSR
jgi:enoyl-CoA hydratase/carnithine racemase